MASATTAAAGEAVPAVTAVSAIAVVDARNTWTSITAPAARTAGFALAA